MPGPGVFVEEIGRGPPPIRGVPTSIAGFVGQARYGPVGGVPVPVTSVAEYERHFGDAADLVLAEGPQVNHLAHAVRLFFANGGRRLHLVRVFRQDADADGRAASPVLRVAGTDAVLRARHPGRAGNVTLRVAAREDEAPDGARMDLLVEGGGAADAFPDLSPHPGSERFIGRVLGAADPASRVVLEAGPLPEDEAARAAFAAGLLAALLAASPIPLTGGTDGRRAEAAQYAGEGATGLAALEAADEVAIVAAPGSAALAEAEAGAVRAALITHAERMRHRFAILAGPDGSDTGAIRATRAAHDSSGAALHHPWLVVSGPADGALHLSPEGAVAGIYARTDAERGVHKAPANEVVRGITGFSRPVTRAEQDLLNADGVNLFRAFPGAGLRLWGARTLSRDPAWRYVSVRRLMSSIEHAIERGTGWTAMEPNGEALWARLRQSVGAFLHETWRSGALVGTKPEDAYFVRCDHSTMTQADLDAGRLVGLVGVAALRPAEFIILRIACQTADTPQG